MKKSQQTDSPGASSAQNPSPAIDPKNKPRPLTQKDFDYVAARCEFSQEQREMFYSFMKKKHLTAKDLKDPKIERQISK